MKKARKKALVIRAFRLGEKSEEIEKLMAEGRIRKKKDGSFEVFSQEAKSGEGEIAYPGDYIKIDSSGTPYPNRAEYFEKHHRHLKEETYEQLPEDLMIWTAEDEICPEITFLMEEKGLTLEPGHPECFFQAPLWGTKLSAARDAVLVFYETERDSEGNICDAEFNFVDREEFEKTYEVIPEKAAVTYDAFISYSHSEPDAFVAKKLHSMLERYRVPKKIQELSGKKKIERVFRDREELPLSSNLASNICEALEHSEYLIVICSPRSLRSEWVQREIETFLLTHGKEKVLTLLVEGEPEEAFPEILCYEEERILRMDGTEEVARKKIEPMAADVRGKDRKETEKKLKEEFLRILAPMLSCTYDTLRQRHRDYVFRRILAAVGGIAVLAILFTIYAFHQAAVTDEQYQEARRNQARYLAGISGELLDTGDRTGALKTALAIVPEDEDAEEPVVPEQMYALNNALYSYNNTLMIDFKADKSYEMEGQTVNLMRDKSQMLSPEGTAYFCLDQMGNAYILDMESGDCIWKIRPEDLEDYDDGEFVWFAPMSEKEAVLVSKHEIRCVNWQEKCVEKVIREKDGAAFYAGSFLCTVDDSCIALSNGETVWVYDLESGSCLQKVNYTEEETYGCYSSNALSFSDDGTMLAIGVSTDYSKLPEKGLFLLSLEDGSVRMLSSAETAAMVWINNERIAAVHYQYVNGKEQIVDDPEWSYRIAVYDAKSGQCLWTSESYNIRAYSKPCTMVATDMEVDGEVQKVLAVSLKDRLILIRPESGEILWEKSYPEDIVGVEKYDENRYLIGLSDGRIYLALMDNTTTDYGVGDISSETICMLYSQSKECVILLVEDSRNVVFLRTIRDEQMEPLSMEKEINKVEYLSVPEGSGDTRVYRCVFYDACGDIDYSGLRIYEPGTSEMIYEYVCQEEDSWIDNLRAQNIEGVPCILFEKYDGREISLNIVDLNTGRTLVDQEKLADTGWQEWNSRSFHTVDQMALYAREAFVITEVTADGITVPDDERAITVEEYIQDVQITTDDRYLILVMEDMEQEEYWLKVWNVEEESWQSIEGEETIPVSDEDVTLGQESSTLAVYSREGNVDIYDLEKGIRTQSIPVGYFDKIDFEYMNHDRYLVVCGDDQYLTLWDVDTGEVRMQNTDNQRNWGNDIYVDGNEHYFGITFDGYMISDDYFLTSQISLYYVDDEGRFYHYVDVPYGCASFEAGEIFVKNAGGSYSPFYSYRELRARAEQVLDGDTLSDAEKRQYFISE